jgi:hypothetical protein
MNGKSTRPPTNWTLILATTGGVLVLGFLFLKGFLLPWQKNARDLDRLEDELYTQDREFKTFMKEKNKLETYRLLGLPRDLEGGSSQYAEYLYNLLKNECKMTGVDIKPSGNEEKPKSQNQGGKVKPGHLALGFQVDAQGDWLSLTKMLEKFQRTPFLHRLRNLTITPVRGGKKGPQTKLSFVMNIEAVVVHKNERRPMDLWGMDPKLLYMDSALALWQLPRGLALAGMLRGQALLFPEMAGRNYENLAWVNPFVGGKPASPYVKEKEVVVKKEDKKKPPVKRSEFRLVLTNPSDQRAILLAGSSEKNTVVTLSGPLEAGIVYLAGAAGCGFRQEKFTVFDGIDTVTGTVLRVDLREVLVEIGGEVYGIGFEKTFADYLKAPLTQEEKTKRGLVVVEDE